MKRAAITLFLCTLTLAGLLYVTRQPVQAQAGMGLHAYRYITTATTTSVRDGYGMLNYVSINGGTTGVVTVYDIGIAGCTGTPGSGKLATIAAVTTPLTMFYDVAVKNGLCIVTAAATDVTITFN